MSSPPRKVLYTKSGMNLFPSKDTISQIALGKESLFFHTSRKTIEIKIEDVRIELFKNKHYSTATRYGSYPYFLYITHVDNPTDWLELGDYYFKLGAALLEMSKVSGIHLDDRAIKFLIKFERKWEEYNTPRAKFYRVVIPIGFALIFLLVFYTCGGR